MNILSVYRTAYKSIRQLYKVGGRGAMVKRPACQSSDPGSILGSAGEKQTASVEVVTDDFV